MDQSVTVCDTQPSLTPQPNPHMSTPPFILWPHFSIDSSGRAVVEGTTLQTSQLLPSKPAGPPACRSSQWTTEPAGLEKLESFASS